MVDPFEIVPLPKANLWIHPWLYVLSVNRNTRRPTETSAGQSWRWSSDLNESLIYVLRYCQHYNKVPIVPLVQTVLCLINSAIDVAVAGFRSYFNCSFLSIKSTSISAERCLLHCCHCTSQKMQMSSSYYFTTIGSTLSGVIPFLLAVVGIDMVFQQQLFQLLQSKYSINF